MTIPEEVLNRLAFSIIGYNKDRRVLGGVDIADRQLHGPPASIRVVGEVERRQFGNWDQTPVHLELEVVVANSHGPGGRRGEDQVGRNTLLLNV